MKLLETGKIGKLVIKNRVVMAAIGIGSLAEPDGRLTDRVIDFYMARVKGGTGLIITCAFRTSREIEQPSGIFFGRRLMIDNDVYVARLNQLAEAAHDYGAKVFIQLTAGNGRNAPPEMLKMAGAVGASPNPAFFDPRITTRALTTEQIEQLVKNYELAARLAAGAGIDGMELNCHAGYLFDEFTDALWNRRTDRYGGSVEGRLRFSLEAIEAVKKGGGADFPVSIKFSIVHHIPGGREIEEGIEIARHWEQAGVDVLDIDSGCYEARYRLNLPTTMPVGSNVDLTAKLKKAVKIPVIAVGKLGDPALAESVLAKGEADFIGLARPLMADPEWANKVREKRLEDIRPCTGDLECHKRMSERKFLSCTVNPACFNEKEMTVEPAARKKSVLVVGGGPAGMEAACTAALRGHRVTLLEKSHALGGNLVAAAAPEFKREYGALLSYLCTTTKKLGVDIQLGREATPELIAEMKSDAVFISTGGTPICPDIPGVHGKNVMQAVALLLDKRKAGKKVVVIGGGLIGCETALHLAMEGSSVTVVEIMGRAMRDMYSINRMHLEKLLAENRVHILTDVRVLQIAGDGVQIADRGDRRSTLEADTVVLAVGMKPNNGLQSALAGKVPELYCIGDCVQPRRVINAMWEGYRMARLV